MRHTALWHPSGTEFNKCALKTGKKCESLCIPIPIHLPSVRLYFNIFNASAAKKNSSQLHGGQQKQRKKKICFIWKITKCEHGAHIGKVPCCSPPACRLHITETQTAFLDCSVNKLFILSSFQLFIS